MFCIITQMTDLRVKGDFHYMLELEIFSCEPQGYYVYSQCDVNGISFVTWQRDQNRKTQNNEVMVEADGIAYYGVLEAVVELKYTEGMSIVLFKCKWYNTEDAF